MKRVTLAALTAILAACFPYPARVVMPVRTRGVDAASGLPISRAQVLRVVCDLHDFSCSHADVDRGETDQEGWIELPGKRRWRVMIPFPGGLPIPNHQIAIWKVGYQAFVFSQYGDVESLKRVCESRQEVFAALQEIPAARRVYTPADGPEELLLDGKVALDRDLVSR